MNRRRFANALGAGVLGGPQLFGQSVPAAAKPSPLSPLDVSDRAQLFVERTVVDRSQKIAFTLHPAEKHPRNPLLVKSKSMPWESWRPRLQGNVIWDDKKKLFRMWYFGGYPQYFADTGHFSLYATSQDGIGWEKPLIGTIPGVNGLRHNAVMRAMLPNVFQDPADPNPARRYKSVSWFKSPDDRTAYHSLISPDGLHWTKHSQSPLAPGGDVISGYYDERRKLYVAFPKTHGVSVRGINRRCFTLITSTDFDHWTSPQLILIPDERDDAGSLRRIEQSRWLLENPDDPKLMRTEFYGLGAYVAESCTIGFPWIFTINNNSRASKMRNQDGVLEIQLAASRDLVTWERHFRTPCVPLGARGEWDSITYYTQSRAIRVGDEVWLYYTGANFSHGSEALNRPDEVSEMSKESAAIGLARWKVDRFVSADGPPGGGSLTTVPVVFSGNRLELNVRTRSRGQVGVEILDAARRPIPGVSMSDPLRDDLLRASVRWKGEDSVGKLAGRPVCMRFHISDAELFSFAFRS